METSWPKRDSTSDTAVAVSSTVSWMRPAMMEALSRRRVARMVATSTVWETYTSPEALR